MTNEQIIKELEDLKRERMEDLMKLNAKHDVLVDIIANINWLIDEAKKD